MSFPCEGFRCTNCRQALPVARRATFSRAFRDICDTCEGQVRFAAIACMAVAYGLATWGLVHRLLSAS